MWGDVGCVRPRILEALLPGARLYRLGNHQPASSMGQDGISSLNVRTRLWDLLLQEVLKRMWILNSLQKLPPSLYPWYLQVQAIQESRKAEVDKQPEGTESALAGSVTDLIYHFLQSCLLSAPC